MARNYDGTDLLWSNTGDFVLGHDGDIADTRFDPLLAAAQDIYDRGKSDIGDWLSAPLLGATISDFTGEPNTSLNGTRLKRRLFNSLLPYGVFDITDVSVDVFPVGISKIVGNIVVRVAPTPRNKSSKIINTIIHYDYGENHVVPTTL